MRIIYLLIICSLAGVLLLWLGIYKKISRKTAAISAALSLTLAGALLLLAVLPGNSFYGKVITHAENTHGRKLIALTFDDGPYPPYTQKLLKLLAAKNVHATFFMVGENAAKHPETVKLVQAQGHLMQAITKICLSSAAAKLPPTSPMASKRCKASPVLHRSICVRRTASRTGALSRLSMMQVCR